MKPLFVALALALASTSAVAAEVESHGPHPFNIRDLVMMDRVGDPQISPDGRYALYTVRATDYAANKGVTSIYLLDLGKAGEPVKLVAALPSLPPRSRRSRARPPRRPRRSPPTSARSKAPPPTRSTRSARAAK